MKNLKGIFSTLVLLAIFLLPAVPSNGACVICDGTENNDGYCVGIQVKACVDDGIFHARCRIGVTSTDECPSIAP